MMIDFGTASINRISLLVRIVLRPSGPTSSPGSIFASDPVAITTFFARTSAFSPTPFEALPTAMVWTPSFAGPCRQACPRTTVTLFFRIRKSKPLTCLWMMPFLRSSTLPQFSLGVPRPSIP